MSTNMHSVTCYLCLVDKQHVVLDNLFMRHDLSTKETVRKLRTKGYSLNQIYQKTQVPKTTIRSWISGVKLTDKQIKSLEERTQKALQKGRIRAQKEQRQIRLKKEEKLFFNGIKELGTLNKRELLIAGISLYWAEGFKNKHEHRLGFCNSDPEMIKFYIKFLNSLGVDKSRLVIRISVNQNYRNKISGIEEFWVQAISISRDQFVKPFFQKINWKKKYDNDNYYGVLRIHVKDSLDLLLRMRGWIQALKSDKISTVKPG
jgi:hypothetical protein